MELQFLGTGAGIPSIQRNVSSVALKLLQELNEVWLFDCGEATQHQILKTSLRPRKINKIFITHMHGDHIFGLPGFLSSRSFQGGEDPVTIIGPPGIDQYVRSSLRLSHSRLSYPFRFIILDQPSGELVFEHQWRVEYRLLNHGIPSYGYRIIEPCKEGELLVDKLKAYQIPNGPIFGQLKRGEKVTLPSGEVLDGRDFIGPTQPGRVVSILGDTKPCKASLKLSHQADVLVHEATHSAAEEEMALSYGHSTTAFAAKLAKDADVKQLYLNHISARYLKSDIPTLQAEAQSIFKSSTVVQDLEEYEIPRRREVNEERA